MKKQKRQLMLMLGIFVVVIAAYFMVSTFKKAEAVTSGYEVVELSAEEVTRLIFTNESGTISLVKDNGIWICDDHKEAELDREKVEQLLRDIAPLSSENLIKDVEDLKIYGLENPAGTIMVSDKDRKHTIFVGDFNDTLGMYYICLEESPNMVYTAQRSAIDSFDVTLEELLVDEMETATDKEEL